MADDPLAPWVNPMAQVAGPAITAAPNLPPWLQKIGQFSNNALDRLGGQLPPGLNPQEQAYAQQQQRMSMIRALLQSSQPRPVGTSSPLADLGNVVGAGQQASQDAAANAMKARMLQIQMMNALAKDPESLGQPQSVLGPDGKPQLMQFGNRGSIRPLSGISPNERPDPSEPLVPIIDPVTKQPKYVTRSEAAGQVPYSPSLIAGNAPPRPEGDPDVESWKNNVLSGNATLQNVPQPLRTSVSNALDRAGKGQYSPGAGSRYTLEASRITHPFTNMSAYKLTADGKPYLERIDAALKNPGSVSDQDLLDSLTKLNTGGNAVTEAQVSLITGGKSFSDMAQTFANKFKNGGVLSPDQRQQIHDIANQIYDNYKKGYQPIYEQAAKQLTDAGIPKAFWTIPDLNTLNTPQAPQGGDDARLQAARDAIAKGAPVDKVKARLGALADKL